MRVIVTGGGSGGHIYPALAIADKFKERDPNTEILYIGNDVGLEKDIVPKSGYPLEMVDAMWVERGNPIYLIRTAVVSHRGVRQALRIMKKFKPDVVVGTGGFVCFPVVIAGHKYGARTYIHEQNAFPGMANRSLERFVDRVLLGFGAASQYFKEPKKHVVVGNPVRDIFFDLDRKECRKALNLNEDDFVVFAVAGSQGANRITDVMYEIAKKLNGKKNIVLIFGAGYFHYETIQKLIRSEGFEFAENIRIMPYIHDMQHYLGASDLIISRAGALAVTEFSVAGCATILIPSPNVPGNHQFYNAKAMADTGGAILMEEKDLTVDSLMERISYYRDHPEELREMEKKVRKAVPHNAAELICDTIELDVRAKDRKRKKKTR
ncbi:MAG: undecaprenyldiphospho-muramoylpentapeptide beta-N-acetylglucosaminyltransferase [Anaerovoracaceae bacterium]|jgi:UDP-N-acetylglucosamine--N-acetylmuramyl-(pentapeptide) pyrophosphoryl-undecaprenol N-acetylglucosamine transferase